MEDYLPECQKYNKQQQNDLFYNSRLLITSTATNMNIEWYTAIDIHDVPTSKTNTT